MFQNEPLPGGDLVTALVIFALGLIVGHLVW